MDRNLCIESGNAEIRNSVKVSDINLSTEACKDVEGNLGVSINQGRVR